MAREQKPLTEPCTACGGSGVVRGRYTEPEAVCPVCGGSGEQPTGEPGVEEQGDGLPA